ncbi:MAG TPA: hypothetical protein VM223_04655 [Planctomycetota bacterium]|nr:hypothetical protein [Planctomycetota bacterium]
MGRTWWMSILTVIVNALLGLLAIHEEVPAEKVIAPLAAITTVAASHNIGRAIEDAAKNKNGANGPPL